MRNFLILTLSIILFSCSEEKSVYPWSDLTFEQAVDLNSDKIIFLDFYSENWGACKRLEVETLNDSLIIDLTEKHLIPINSWQIIFLQRSTGSLVDIWWSRPQ